MNTSISLCAERSRALGSLVHLPAGAVYVEEGGSLEGEPIVLVHGIAASRVIWKLLFPFLVRQGYRVITYDLFGRGLSDRPRVPNTPELFRNQLEGVLNALKIETPITLVGLSMGGLVAADFAVHHPHRIGRLAMMAPAGVPTFRPWWYRLGTERGVGELVLFLGGQRMLSRLMRRSFSSTSVARLWTPRLMEPCNLPGYKRSLLSSMRHMPLSEGMSIFETVGLHDYPVGLFWGDQDEICPYENRNAVLQSIPRAHLYIVEGGGHAVHLDRPDIFQRAFLRFLEA